MQNISIGTIARRTGLAVSAVRYYDDIGLLQSNRNRGGHRRFEKSQIRRASFILAAQRLGFSLDEIKSAMDDLPQARTPTRQDWTRLSQKFRHRIDAQIQQLQTLRDTLDGCIGCGCLSLSACKLYNPDDQMGRDGPGPRKLMPPK